MSREPDVLEVDYSVTAADYLAFNVYHNRRNRLVWLVGVLVACILLLICVIGLAAQQGFDDDDHSGTLSSGQGPAGQGLFLLAPFGLLLLGFLLFFVLRPWLVGISARAMLRKNPGMVGPQRITLTPEGVAAEDRSGYFFRRWWGVQKVVVTKDHVFIYFSTITAVLIPRRAFPEEGDFTEFVETARSWHELGKTRTVPVPADAGGRWQARKPTGIQAPPERDDSGTGEGVVPK